MPGEFSCRLSDMRSFFCSVLRIQPTAKCRACGLFVSRTRPPARPRLRMLRERCAHMVARPRRWPAAAASTNSAAPTSHPYRCCRGPDSPQGAITLRHGVNRPSPQFSTSSAIPIQAPASAAPGSEGPPRLALAVMTSPGETGSVACIFAHPDHSMCRRGRGGLG